MKGHHIATGAADIAAPEFIMLGTKWKTGVAIIASTELTRAELVAKTFFIDDDAWPPSAFKKEVPIDSRFEVFASMKTYVIAYGQTYPQALAALLTNWKPPGDNADKELP